MSRRGHVAALVLAAWAVGLGLLARRQLSRSDAERLAEAATRVTPGAVFYAVFQGSRQIGFASSTIDTTASGISVADYLVADLPVGGALHRATARTRVDMTRALRVRTFSLSLDSDAGPVRVTGRVLGDTLLTFALASGPDRPDTQRVRIEGPILMPTTLPLAIALGDRPDVGQSYSLPVFDPAAMGPRPVTVSVTAESLFVLSDSAVFDAGAGRWTTARRDTVRAWQLAADGAMGFGGWVDEQGRLVEATQLGSLTLRRMAYEEAFENWRIEATRGGGSVAADDDIMETTAIAASAPIRTRQLRRLTVRLTNVDLAGYDLQGARQALRGDTLIVEREDDAALVPAYTLPAGMRERFPAELAAEPLIQSRHSDVVDLARRLSGGETDPRAVAERINRWVYDSLRKRITFGVPSALQVLRARSGDCNEHTQLYLALARAAGIPARSAAGLAYVRGKFYYHAWPEVYLGRWIAVDPTFGQFPADAAHLRFVTGGLGRQAELLRLIGSLQVDVLETR
ncbi:MAG TPA: transglutaminase-like domain-containing protein [Gemmatimonadaceae bacterium]|nr:transglutaminase-like domain-containing protein [Gemmatimonadaceae bacterium]